MSDFIQLVKERRSATNFLPGYSITKEALNEIFELVKQGAKQESARLPKTGQ